MMKTHTVLMACSAMTVVMCCCVPDARAQQAGGNQPWLNPTLSPDRRATLAEQQFSLDELFGIVDGSYAVPANWLSPANVVPPEAIGSAGYVPGAPELNIPALQESDAGTGVADPDHNVANYSTELPSGMATAATWDVNAAFLGGSMIGHEAHQEGFNVLLAGGVDLAREARNGRNFEYGGEDPLLAGTMVGQQVRGIQAQHVVSTVKHFAINDQETGRSALSSDIDWTAARQSDLLAFELALDIGKPGSVMCSYNQVNSVYACGNDTLLNQTLKHDWRFKGWVMSDWGAAHSVLDANAGLDQESGSFFDEANGGPFFTDKLTTAVASGAVKPSRLYDMAHRILRSEFAAGLIDNPSTSIQPIDPVADAAVAQADEEEGAVLLQNTRHALPLAKTVGRIAVIGSNAINGVMEGGGSSIVWPVGGPAAPVDPNTGFPGPVMWNPSSPVAAIKAEAPNASVTYDSGADPATAATAAAGADVAIVFVNQWLGESIDATNLSLQPDLQTNVDQNALVAAVAKSNPNTIVVIESGGAVLMPWLGQVKGVIEGWYPGAGGGPALARILFGDVNPSGHLPITFPASEQQLPRPVLDVWTQANPNFHVNYNVEGAAVGYKWFQKNNLTPLFPFGFGLSYTNFAYSNFNVQSGGTLSASFSVTNIGHVAGYAVPQIYLGLAGRGESPTRLVAFSKVLLNPGQTRNVTVKADPRLLANFNGATDKWNIVGGSYQVLLASSSAKIEQTTTTTLQARNLAP